MKKNVIWIFLVIIGFIPFIYGIVISVSDAIRGTSGLCVGADCVPIYGFKAFIETFGWILLLRWPIYLIALLLIIISFIMLIIGFRKK